MGDESLALRFRSPLNVRAKRWVLQYGSEVEVLGPPELREWVRGEARKVLGEGSGEGD